jgi:N-acetyl-gamma-glutamyl-phosphate reductase
LIRVGIIGATGYGGRELLRLLGMHPGAGVVACASTTASGEAVADVLPPFRGLTDLRFETFDAEDLAARCDVVFVGVPGKESMKPVAALRRAGARVVDIGPDFRLLDLDAFRQYYQAEHEAAELLSERVYGLPPFYREALKSAKLVAVPGCYPISAVVPLRPLTAACPPAAPIVIDSVSGVSGAGRTPKQNLHFPEMNDNVWAYKVSTHQHIPEIEQEIGGALVQFTPHVGPYTRGILSTITYRPSHDVNLDEVYAAYSEEPFVRVLGEGKLPDLSAVRASNFVDFGWVRDARTGNLVIVSAVDNLMGGTAGMAIQCMNLMFGLDERVGLTWGGLSV